MDAAANDGNGAEDDEEDDEPTDARVADWALPSPAIGFSTTPGFAASGAATATLKASEVGLGVGLPGLGLGLP